MERKYVAAGAAVAIAVLLPLGRWVIASRQDAADQAAARQVQHQFVMRQAAATGAGQQQTGGSRWMQGGGQGGPGGQAGRWRRGGGQPGQGRGRMMTEMAKEVGLSPTQVKQIQAVQESTRPMMSDVFRNPQLSREQKMAAIQQIRQAQQAQIGKFLTPDQQAKYATFQQKMRAQWQARRRENAGPGSAAGGPPAGGQG